MAGIKPGEGYNPLLGINGASFNEKANKEWHRVQATNGEAYVPDVELTMGLTTMQINLAKLDKWIAHYSTQPVPENLKLLYDKEVGGKGKSITTVVNNILKYLGEKRAKYVQAINTLSVGGSQPLNPADPYVDVPGAASPDAAGSPSTDGISAGLLDGSNGGAWKKKAMIGAAVLLGLVVVIIVVKKLRK